MPVIIVFLVIALPVLCVTALLFALIFRGGGSRKRATSEGEEARCLQEMYQGLNRLEQRIESLETILIERERTKERTL